MQSLAHDKDQLRAIGHGALALINVGIVLAIIATILSNRSATPQIITSAFGFVSWLVAQVTTPVSGGYVVPLTATLAPAFGGSSGGSSSGTGGAAGGASGAGGGMLGGASTFPDTSSWGIGTGDSGGVPATDNIPTMTIRPGG
jgi:hypothetical protein